MTRSLLVTAPGLAATLQDMGRPGYQALGVPVSGALDPDVLQIANWLVENDGGEGAIEMRFGGPAFEAQGDAVRVALAGAGAEIRLGPSDEDFIPAWRSATIQPGQRFRIVLRGGAACYLAVGGGFALAPELGSVSTLASAGLGGFGGRALAEGDLLPLRRARDASGGERS
jgi:allophanate hydrolase subunit 2